MKVNELIFLNMKVDAFIFRRYEFIFSVEARCGDPKFLNVLIWFINVSSGIVGLNGDVWADRGRFLKFCHIVSIFRQNLSITLQKH